MAALWKSPLYTLNAPSGAKIKIDVTTSISAGLQPSNVLTDTVIPFFLSNGIQRIVDFGAGALRHTLPLLAAGFEVSAVQFESALARPAAAAALAMARGYGNFTSLVWPHDFLRDRTRFDAALLCYVLQTMRSEGRR